MFTHDVRKIDATPLDQIAFFDQTGHTAATGRACPAILAECLSVQRRQRIDDTLLQVTQIAFDAMSIKKAIQFKAIFFS